MKPLTKFAQTKKTILPLALFRPFRSTGSFTGLSGFIGLLPVDPRYSRQVIFSNVDPEFFTRCYSCCVIWLFVSVSSGRFSRLFTFRYLLWLYCELLLLLHFDLFAVVLWSRLLCFITVACLLFLCKTNVAGKTQLQ